MGNLFYYVIIAVFAFLLTDCASKKTKELKPETNTENVEEAAVEVDSFDTSSYVVTEIELGERHYITIREKIDPKSSQEFYAKNLSLLLTDAKDKGAELVGSPSGLLYGWNAQAGLLDVAAAIGVKDPEPFRGTYKIMTYDPGLYISTDHYGSFKQVNVAHAALEKYKADNNMLMGRPVIEEYVTDPSTVTKPEEVLTRLYYPVKRK